MERSRPGLKKARISASSAVRTQCILSFSDLCKLSLREAHISFAISCKLWCVRRKLSRPIERSSSSGDNNSLAAKSVQHSLLWYPRTTLSHPMTNLSYFHTEQNQSLLVNVQGASENHIHPTRCKIQKEFIATHARWRGWCSASAQNRQNGKIVIKVFCLIENHDLSRMRTLWIFLACFDEFSKIRKIPLNRLSPNSCHISLMQIGWV
jgi:hypothetical protein